MNETFHKLFDCIDCGINTHDIHEYYMVRNSIWFSLGLKDNRGMLCIGCLEKRLGRRLDHSDFPNLPINTSPATRFSDRLLSRLGLP